MWSEGQAEITSDGEEVAKMMLRAPDLDEVERLRTTYKRASHPEGRLFEHFVNNMRGNPNRQIRSMSGTRVYPRASGETYWRARQDEQFTGLSPRMRGNPVRCAASHCHGGSIPAWAGNTPIASN